MCYFSLVPCFALSTMSFINIFTVDLIYTTFLPVKYPPLDDRDLAMLRGVFTLRQTLTAGAISTSFQLKFEVNLG